MRNFVLTDKRPFYRSVFILLFTINLFFRFYDLEGRTEFRWDQVDNAWVAKDIIIDHKLPLVGMVAKQNTGFYIGPLYYYFITPFYWVFNLDPISAGVIAGVSSVITFLGIFYFTKKLFSLETSLVALFLYTFSLPFINADRFQWPVNFLPVISFAILYSLYRSITVSYSYLFLLAFFLGISFNLHFTAVFFLIAILFSLPLFRFNKDIIKYFFISLLIIVLFLIPNIVYEIRSGGASGSSIITYITAYYHGFHLRRMLQIAQDAFLEFGEFSILSIVKPLRFLLFPFFAILYLREKLDHKRLVLVYLMGLWIIVPWVIFSVYSGEITNYYFSITRPIAIVSLAFLISYFLQSRHLIFRIFTVLFLSLYLFINIQGFFSFNIEGLSYHRKKVLDAIKEGRVIQFQQGVPESYIYFYYTNLRKIK
jgi:4-amino-4-deoxy-L-arabinose transferase-like glycosyltransferase